MKGGVDVIKSHPYFKGVDWDDMYALRVPSPYVPKVSSEGDASNFDKYEEESISWCDDGVDPYEDIFKDF